MVASTGKVQSEHVVVVHGFLGKRLSMLPLVWRLQRRGLHVTTWNYFSLGGSLNDHARRLSKYLDSQSARKKVHIVAHSMGCVVVRAALAIQPLPNMGRVVLLAPPNCGTPVARFADRLIGWGVQTITEVSDRQDSLVNQLPDRPPYDVGVIAARFDMVVPVSKTHLASEQQHAVLNASHVSLILSATTARMTRAFIDSGSFHG